MIRLTIITICYNDAKGLEKTLASVATQNRTWDTRDGGQNAGYWGQDTGYWELEHVIVDGGSTDGSVEVITGYRLKVTGQYEVKWVSEPDKGIYNAMNKGIRMATGEYLLFLNSGDVLADNDVLMQFMKSDLTADVASGIERMPGGRFAYPKREDELTYDYFYNDTLRHQSTFIRRDAFEKYGMYREDYRIVSDWEWFFRVMLRDNATYQTLDFVVADFDGGGISNSQEQMQKHETEKARVYSEILPRMYPEYEELQKLRLVAEEYEHLKAGKFGWLVKLCLKIKQMKKK